MILKLQDDSMLEIWRHAAGFEPSLSEASIERFDSLDVNVTMRRAMRAWYLDLIATGDLGYLRVDDITDRVAVVAGARNGEWRVTLPADTGRIVSVELIGYGTVPLVRDDRLAEYAASGDNRYLRVGGAMKAVVSAGSRELRVYGPVQPEVSRLRAVTIPEDDTYILDERALGLIPDAVKKIMTF